VTSRKSHLLPHQKAPQRAEGHLAELEQIGQLAGLLEGKSGLALEISCESDFYTRA
jgi:hypothetical protein